MPTAILSPLADTSGIPRPIRLYIPPVDPSKGSYVRQETNITGVIGQGAVIGVLRVMLLEVGCDRICLVIWNGVKIAETTARRVVHGVWKASGVIDCTFRIADCISWVYLCRSNAGDKWTCTGPCRIEDIEIRT
jgi:hypothetical protein